MVSLTNLPTTGSLDGKYREKINYKDPTEKQVICVEKVQEFLMEHICNQNHGVHHRLFIHIPQIHVGAGITDHLRKNKLET